MVWCCVVVGRFDIEFWKELEFLSLEKVCFMLGIREGCVVLDCLFVNGLV